MAVATPTRQLLVVSESYHPGWQAAVDGVPQPVLRVNGDFLGCVVGPGKADAWCSNSARKASATAGWPPPPDWA